MEFEAIVRRVRGEFLEMPGLTLTVAQAGRLWGLEQDLCHRVIGTLVGIIPGTTAFSIAGAGLGSVIEAQNRIYQACLAKAPANPEL